MASQSVTTNQQGKPAKRRNHTVPKALLKRWLTKEGEAVGHWVLDCKTATIGFRPGTEASFAISEFRYVPVRAPQGQPAYRDETVEDWFSRGENDLALVTDRLGKKQSLAGASDAIGGFIQAAVLLGFRSAYEYELFDQALKHADPSLTEDEVTRRVVDHFKTTYAAKLRQFSNWDYQIVPSLDQPLLICDRPMFDMTIRGESQEMLVVPLTPSVMLVGRAPSDIHRKSLSLTVSDRTSPAIADLLNRFTVERAREFIVGLPAQLKALQPSFAAQAFSERKALDRFVFEDLASRVRVPVSDL
jgi:hypothetical protein